MTTSTSLATRPDALAAWQQRTEAVFRDIFRPAPILRPSEWAEENRIISVGPNSGQRWRNETTPYLVEILDFIANPWARRGVVRKSARVGFTEGVIGNGVGFLIDQDPCPIAIVQPSDKEAEAYSKEQIGPMIAANPTLASRIGPMNVRSSDSTITYKEFPGGYLAIMGSASDKNLRRRSLRVIFVDEVDGMRVEGIEGDPLARLAKRTDDYEDGVMLVGSTPTVKGLSRIDREFERSDQRYWNVPCPHCGEFQVLRWGGPEEPFGVKWDQEEREGKVVHLPETAYYLCAHCGSIIPEELKPAMVQAGRWIVTQPEASFPGWQLDAFMSLFPGARWGKLAAEFLEAKDDPEDLKVWVNTVAGQAWEDRGEQVSAKDLEGRAAAFVGPDGEPVLVPDGVGVLTFGVDVQGDRLELLIVGWGAGFQSWDIIHERVYGDPEATDTWARLDGWLARTYRHEHGTEMRLMAGMIDAGYSTSAVYRFVKPRSARNVWASMGDRSGDERHVPLKRPTRANAAGVKVFTIGTFQMKKSLLDGLRVQRPGPRFVHLRSPDPDICNGFDAEYFAQFEAEVLTRRRIKGSQRIERRFIQRRPRNEAIDLRVMNMAALHALGAPIMENLGAMAERMRELGKNGPNGKDANRTRARSTQTRRKGGDWATGWK